jgi:hypothetical protein
MFLSDLTPDCKVAFLDLARLLIAADGVQAPEELEMLNDVAREMEIELAGPSTSRGVEELCEGIRRPEAQAQILMELASLAHVDDDYSSEERLLLQQVGALWKINPITMIRIEAWAAARIEMSREAAEIIQEITTWNP